MPYVSVDLDWSEISTDELVDETIKRLKDKRIRPSRAVTDKEKKELKECVIEMSGALKLTVDDTIEVKTLDDKMKYEHLVKVFHKYTAAEIEKALPS